MRSEKALSLFNQTVGIKVLGNLDEFIRLNMLEPQEAEVEFLNLKENYNTLLQAHSQIEKATEQAKQLQPVRDLARSLEDTDNHIRELDTLKETGNIYFDVRLDRFLSHEIEKENRTLVSLSQKMQTTEQQQQEFEERKTDLSVAIARDETGQMIKQIESQLNQKNKEVNTREIKQEKYNKLAAGLNLPGPSSEALFAENREKAFGLKEKNIKDIKGVEEQQYQVRKSADDHEKEFNMLEEQVRQLRGQKNKITGRVSEIRSEIISRERFVLGWDNKEKIKVLVTRARELLKKIEEKKEKLKKFERQSQKIRRLSFLNHDQ